MVCKTCNKEYDAPDTASRYCCATCADAGDRLHEAYRAGIARSNERVKQLERELNAPVPQDAWAESKNYEI